MKLSRINLDNVKIISGSVLVPDPLIFNTREDAMYFGDSRRVSAGISQEKYSPSNIDFLCKKINKNVKNNGR